MLVFRLFSNRLIDNDRLCTVLKVKEEKRHPLWFRPRLIVRKCHISARHTISVRGLNEVTNAKLTSNKNNKHAPLTFQVIRIVINYFVLYYTYHKVTWLCATIHFQNKINIGQYNLSLFPGYFHFHNISSCFSIWSHLYSIQHSYKSFCIFWGPLTSVKAVSLTVLFMISTL